jgi:hypothetical protein
MTCTKAFTSVAEGVTNIKLPAAGISAVFNQPGSTITASVDAGLLSPAVSGTFTLEPATFTLSSKRDTEGGMVVDATVSPNLTPFDATLKISPLKNNEFVFGIRRTFGSDTTWSLGYCSARQAGSLTVEPKLTLTGGTQFSGRLSVSTVDPLAGSAAIEFAKGITFRGCYCAKDSPEKPLKVAAFWSGAGLTLGAATAFKELEGPVELSFFLKTLIAKGLVLAGIARIPTTANKSSVEIRAEKLPCQCPGSSGAANIGVVVKYEPGKFTWSAGAKFAGASLAVQYTEAKALGAVLALPVCSTFAFRPTLSATWKSLIKPAIGIELVFGE